ncbi:MAG: M50 family metallopeptidase [Tepidisphaeraceae bacterium]
MAWQDRHYYRDPNPSAGNPLMWLVAGSVPLFTVFGIRVRAHASLIIYAALVLLLGYGPGFVAQDRVISMTMLFGIVLLHEFGHCFAARWLGGNADDILMHPLGGLAFASPPRRWLPTFLTVAAGPAVNVIICVLCGAALYAAAGELPRNPFIFDPPVIGYSGWLDIWRWTYWAYQTSWMLLCFNLLPIYPLDGGQMVQAALWPRFGYYKSMNFSCIVGMVASVLGAMIALATRNIMLAILAAMGFVTCLNMRRMLLANGPEEYQDETDYSAAYEIEPEPKRRRRARNWSSRRAAKLARAERVEQARIDAILAKVSATGMNSLTWQEKRFLKKASDHQKKRDFEVARARRGL